MAERDLRQIEATTSATDLDLAQLTMVPKPRLLCHVHAQAKVYACASTCACDFLQQLAV